ncbi:hypothetical protein DM860_003964 [Cuscuta australis]|uniref:Nuclear pore complex protein NUP1 n=1 Tax=Cuscuta australis TaxID=267555 RepID=A0A328CV02_9ASTE|nr:hypothetical protein DM860_003964 [Cuscuta australis]
MATVGQDTTAAASSPTTHPAAYEVGGAGGKFRKRPFRRGQSTPYDRPPTSIRNPSWLSKLVVDPASKLINAGARRFFASLFQKALPPPPVLPAIAAPPPPATQQDSRDICQTSVPNSHAGDRDPDLVKHGDAACNSKGSAFSELEHLLKQKTFTRSEIDRLTELLHSKAAYSSLEDAGNRIDVSKPASDFSKSLVRDYKADKGVCHGVTSTAFINKKIVEDDVATPAELAKTYMGSRQSKVSLSMPSFRGQTVKEVVPYVSQSPMKFSKRPVVPDNGFTTPKSHGRSAVYNMVRTPYSRVRPTNFHQGGSSSFYPNAGPSSSQSRLEHDDVFGSKQWSLKRRSSVLEDDGLGCIGPIRRTRQKSNLFYNNHDASLPIGGTESSSKNYPFVNRTLGKNQDSEAPSTSRFHVPNKSSETAARILEVISKLSPREKASESKRTTIKDNKLPSQLTTDMLHGQARKSLEHLDSSRFLQTAPITAETEKQATAMSPDGGNPTLPKLNHVEESRPTKFADTASHVASSGVTLSEGDFQVNADTVYPMTVAPPVKEKRAFKMSALEDSFELDDDIESTGIASKPLSEGKGKQEIAPVGSTLVSSEVQLQHKSASLTETSTSPGGLSKKICKENPNNVHAGVNGSDPSISVCLPDFNSKNAYATETEGSSLTLPGSKLGILSGLNKNVSTASDSSPQLPVGDNSQKIGINGHLVAPLNASTSTTTTTNLFAAPSNNSSNGNRSFQLLAANNSESHAVTNVSVLASSNIAAATTNVSTTSSVFGLTGSSMFSPTTFSAPTASTTETPDVKAQATKMDNAINVDNLKTSTSISGTSVPDTSNIFGLKPSEKPCIATQPQGSLFSTGGDSVSTKFLTQSGNSSGPQVSPLFGFSKSSPGLGTSDGVSTSSSPFTSTAPTESPFGSDSLRPTSAESNRIGSGSSSPTSSISAFGNNTDTSFGTTSNGVSTFTPNFVATSVSSPLETKVLTPSIGTTTALSSSSTGGPTISFTSGSTVSTFSTSITPTPFSFSASSASPTNPGVLGVSGSSAASSFSSTASGLFTSTAASSGNTTPGVFIFNGNSTNSSSSSPGPFGFTSGSTPSFPTTTSPGPFAFAATSAASSSNTTTPAVFGFTGSSTGNSGGQFNISVSSTTTAGSNTTTPATFNFTASSSASSSTGFPTLGTSSSTLTMPKTPPTPFGTNPAAATSGPVFPFRASATTPQPIFGNSAPLSSPFSASQDQMTMEDTMAEDQFQAGSAPAPVSVFGQPPSNTPAAPPGSFMFSTPSLSPNPFQYNQGAPPPQNPSPFQPSTSLEFNNGSGSFSLGSSGPDKSGRRIVKVNRAKNRRK